MSVTAYFNERVKYCNSSLPYIFDGTDT